MQDVMVVSTKSQHVSKVQSENLISAAYLKIQVMTLTMVTITLFKLFSND